MIPLKNNSLQSEKRELHTKIIPTIMKRGKDHLIRAASRAIRKEVTGEERGILYNKKFGTT